MPGARTSLRTTLSGLLLAALAVTPPGAEATAPPAVCARPTLPARELRGLWVASVSNINWPSRSGLPASTQQQEYLHLLDEAQRLRMNSVFVQVRPTADAFYPSTLEPWSEYLTGEQGGNPGYDPMAFLVTEAHRRNLEFHAWLNPYRVSLQPDPNRLVANHPARQHPDWTFGYGGQLYYDPGVPQARAFVERVVLDTATRYDVDGVHFDDYFYPYPVASAALPDERTYQRYGAARFPDRGDWRRDNVNTLVRELSAQIHAARPQVAFGVSPFGVWRDSRTDPTGSDTTAGVHDYDDLYADTRTWIQHRWIDYVAPQLYWPIGFVPAAYDRLVPWWSHEVESTGVSLYVGQAASRIGKGAPPWNDPEEMPRHLQLNAAHPQVAGDLYWSISDVLANPLGFADRLLTDFHRTPALVPVRATLPGAAPPPPAMLSVTGKVLRWRSPPAVPGHPAPTYYAVYRTDGCVITLLGTIRATQDKQTFTDRTPDGSPGDRYLVTALDRAHHESRQVAGTPAPAPRELHSQPEES